jgi:hypothetical protein
MKFFTRLTPTVPGEAGVFRVPSQGRIVTGFVSGGPTEGVGFPQWGVSGHQVSHYFGRLDATGFTESMCGRAAKHTSWIMLPGNYARCKDCEKRYTKALRK